ncbi:MAG: hydantoinase B/oxoprolinase family protein [Pseudomonadota bacterium]|nr:hydantoinase B/oxoprolinase family protein [Pseudomonadota bacterium]
MSLEPNSYSNGWQFWIDRGGTFTDLVARNPDGKILTHKILSENPEHYSDAALQGIRDLLELDPTEPIPSGSINVIRMGTTVGTNALLERSGEPTVLAITKGFADALRIGYQERPNIFDHHIQLPELLYEKVIEINERKTAGGKILTVPDNEIVKIQLSKIFDLGIRSVAIVLMHGYRFPSHENIVAKIAKEVGFTQVSTSNQVSPLMKLISRGDTTVVDAYISPILRRYIDGILEELSRVKKKTPRLQFMQSNGGLTDENLFQGKNSILSGPAGGVVGMACTASEGGFKKVIGFDMGGTSTDVSHFNGEFERTFETTVAGIRICSPMMRIHTVAAGGGSIIRFSGQRFRVGPDSAGADPGPACYRRGGPLTITDCNLMVGKIQAEHFPHIFGPNANEPLDEKEIQKKFTDLATQISPDAPDKPEDVAEGFLKIAVENMANAIKKVSVQRGYDVTEYTLNCFGGAGGQHACMVADALGIEKIFIHPFAGILSAYGIGLADIRAIREKTIETPIENGSYKPLQKSLKRMMKSLEKEAVAEISEQGITSANTKIVRQAHLRYEGTDSYLSVPFDQPKKMIENFEKIHKKRYGFSVPERSFVVEAITLEAIGLSTVFSEPEVLSEQKYIEPVPQKRGLIYCEKEWLESKIYKRGTLKPGNIIFGPSIIQEESSTTVIEHGWKAELTKVGHLILSRNKPLSTKIVTGAQADPVRLEIFNNLFMSIAEQMGGTLANTSQSVNIKERLDFSCAIFDSEGGLIANAPHIPVHLGSMGDSIITVINENKDTMKPGDVYALNAPYNGGTHLPDITVITPIYDELCQNLLFFVGSRGHHADIGGITPGSMPPNSTNVEQEGILIDNFLLSRNGQIFEDELLAVLKKGPYPARNPDQNLADLKAQIAANEKGAQELKKIVSHFGLEVVLAYMKHVQDNAEESVRQVINVLRNGSFTLKMDNGAIIKVHISIDKNTRSAKINFSGTSNQLNNNFNAPEAVSKAAVLYVFRTLVNDDIPLNSGCFKPIEVFVPKGSLLNPLPPAAVVAGNVETSQCIVDAIFGALGVLAASQGTMNNFTFGNDKFQYYETICGGSGAGPGFKGTDAVQTHMTNSRLTDPEVLEWRFPVILESFSIRHGSAGIGCYKGGNGTIRRVRFLKPMTAAILSNNRDNKPHGLNGGKAGSSGINKIERKNGKVEELRSTDTVEMKPGDVFVIATPGGGGFGNL